MVNEINQKENPPETQSGDQSPPEVEEMGESAVSEAGIAELESLVAQKDEELAKASARLIELEQAVAGKDSEMATLQQSNDELAEAVASYKTVVVQANPEVIDELINGGTIEAINESLSKAKDLVSKVRQGVEAEISSAKIPAGAPERTSPDLSALSPREKIQYAVGGFSSRNR